MVDQLLVLEDFTSRIICEKGMLFDSIFDRLDRAAVAAAPLVLGISL